ncbi:type 1 fimbrial protein [Burkholderia gladioli]|uniref:type 1 fimbrial protein n=1 Tax=Burkholderia gladioli TaxID=28095 RepID=UPI00163ED123|nr:type 1 fimbrial protein [Burkholderia gladioli]
MIARSSLPSLSSARGFPSLANPSGWRRLAVLTLAACALLALPGTAAHAQGGTIQFSGRIVEPPCSFQVDAAATRVQPNCARPAFGQVGFVDLYSGRKLGSSTLTIASAPFAIPGQGTRRNPMIVTVDYR